MQESNEKKKQDKPLQDLLHYIDCIHNNNESFKIGSNGSSVFGCCSCWGASNFFDSFVIGTNENDIHH